MASRRVVVIGGGPAGLEAALACLELGHRVTVLERGDVGSGVTSWGHVRLFSPWSLNMSERGRAVLSETPGITLPDADDCPTGDEYVAQYLRPLASHITVRGEGVLTHYTVVDISRDGWLKGEHIGASDRTERPFRILCDTPDGEAVVFADTVIDASGTYGNGLHLGPGGAWAVGERTLDAEVVRTIPRAGEHDMAAYAARYGSRRTVVIGGGYSAIAAIRDLLQLQNGRPQTELHWVLRGHGEPYTRIENDTLPDRDRLAELGNALAVGDPRVQVHRGDPVALARVSGGVSLSVRTGDAALDTFEVDNVVSLVGYRPDTSIYGQLQVHTCYGTDGPMKLAAQLMASDGAGGDCLSQTSAGPDVLRTTEPDFYVLGAKSYGRRSNYLLRLGIEQAEDLMTLLA